MGKKQAWTQKKPSKKEAANKGDNLTEKKLTMNIHLHKLTHGIQFKKKAPRAIKEIKKIVKRQMFTKDVRVDPELNKQIWRNGIRNLPVRIQVSMERKKNENEEEGQEKMYTLVKFVPGLKEEKKE